MMSTPGTVESTELPVLKKYANYFENSKSNQLLIVAQCGSNVSDRDCSLHITGRKDREGAKVEGYYFM